MYVSGEQVNEEDRCVCGLSPEQPGKSRDIHHQKVDDQQLTLTMHLRHQEQQGKNNGF